MLLDSFLDNKEHVIWDWNGTLLDDVDLCVESISEILRRYGLSPITRDTYRREFRFPVVEYYRAIGLGSSGAPFEQVADEFIEYYQARVHRCRLYNGTRECLERLSERGVGHSLLSAAKQDHIMEQLAPHRIESYFEHVCGIADHYASGKIERGRELLGRLDLPKDSVILIGDTDHDLEVAKSLGVDVLLLGDGHQAFERLKHLHSRVLPSRTAVEFAWDKGDAIR